MNHYIEVPNYGMFSGTGNLVVESIVKSALELNLDWDSVTVLLHNLSKVPTFEEATDTAVREAVWMEFNRG